MKKISAVIITKNEEKLLENCLESLYWVDEIIVVDSESTDNTVNISKKYTDKVYVQKWLGFSEQKNFANKKVSKSSKYILSIDADERCTPELIKEITTIINKNPKYDIYEIPRKNILLGKELKYGGWYQDFQKRLFRNNSKYRWKGDIHETIDAQQIGKLKNGFIHLTHRSIDTMLSKTIQYSQYEAEKRLKQKYRKVNLFVIFKEMALEFGYRCIYKRGYKDGMEGWIEIIYQTFSKFITYARLWQLQQNPSIEDKYRATDKFNIKRLNEKNINN